MSSEAGLFFGLYETYGLNGLPIFVLVTVVLGGAAAFASGRAVADSWGDVRLIVFYAALLGLAARFIQHSIFGQPLLPLGAYLIDVAVLMFAFIGYRARRTTQMTGSYPWLFAKSTPLTWRKKP